MEVEIKLRLGHKTILGVRSNNEGAGLGCDEENSKSKTQGGGNKSLVIEIRRR